MSSTTKSLDDVVSPFVLLAKVAKILTGVPAQTLPPLLFEFSQLFLMTKAQVNNTDDQTEM